MSDNICFGCGSRHPEGLRIKSRWEGEISICRWSSQEKYQGWPNILNGGILATLIDCHCMCTAMAAAYQAEGRGLDSQPHYRYATGTLNVRYLKPTPNDQELELRSKVTQIKGRKVVMECEVWAADLKTATAEVIAIRVADSSQVDQANPFQHSPVN
ncbi:MAG: PaaI family thioesterase [Bacteroidota bacterium]